MRLAKIMIKKEISLFGVKEISSRITTEVKGVPLVACDEILVRVLE